MASMTRSKHPSVIPFMLNLIFLYYRTVHSHRSSVNSEHPLWTDSCTSEEGDKEDKAGRSCFSMAALLAWVLESGSQVVHSTTLLLSSRSQVERDEGIQLLSLTCR